MGFEEFVGNRLGVLLRYATVLSCDPHLAEDIVQDVLLKAHLNWQRITAAEHPEAYVKRMIVNEFLSWHRSRRRSAALIPVSTPADPTIGVDQRDEMLRRIAALPPRQRAVIALRFYEGSTDEEIARLLGCTPATVRSHCSRALEALRLGMDAGSQGRR